MFIDLIMLSVFAFYKQKQAADVVNGGSLF